MLDLSLFNISSVYIFQAFVSWQPLFVACLYLGTLPPRRDLSSVRAFQIAANIFRTIELSATTIHTFIILRQ